MGTIYIIVQLQVEKKKVKITFQNLNNDWNQNLEKNQKKIKDKKTRKDLKILEIRWVQIESQKSEAIREKYLRK